MIGPHGMKNVFKMNKIKITVYEEVRCYEKDYFGPQFDGRFVQRSS